MAKQDGRAFANREVKDSAFTAYFREPENACKLYAALGDGEVSPEFYVFYNGDEPCPPEKILRLSNAFLDKTEHPMVELEVKVININLPSGHRLLRDCRPLYEYSWFIQRIKDYLRAGWVRDEAITQAVKDCMEEGILTEFMKEHGSEVVNMLYTQWNYDDAVAVERKEAYEDGRIAESRQVIYTFLENLGEIPEDIRSRIEGEQDSVVLKKWYIAAPGVKSFDEFRKLMDE